MGFSGATVTVREKDVVKASTDTERLAESIAKQEWLRRVLGDLVCIPQPISWEQGEDNLLVVMEKAEGQLLEDWVATASSEVAYDMGRRLAYIVEVLSLQAPHSTEPIREGEFLKTKLSDVRAHLGAGMTSVLNTGLIDLSVFDDSPTGCHGDLAFDNIIIDADERIWLLDALPQAFDHWRWDVAKFMQSTYINWPAIRDNRITESILRTKAPGSADIAAGFFDALLVDLDAPITALYFAVALARIIPYASTVEQKEALLHLVNIQLGKVI